jgi:tryptophan halogenase
MDKLRINSAFPFNIPQSKKEIKPYTIARAMEYGWLWQIPLQNRWGCGYLFDDKLINIDTIKKELESHFGFSIQSNRVIKFEAGRYENVWVNNCIAVGLSSGFTEPLEATSILLSLISLNELQSIDLFNTDLSKVNVYNNKISKCNDEVVDFLQLHYITKRNENEFWKWYNDNKNISSNLSNILNLLRNGNELELDTDSIFTSHSWFVVSKGLGIINDSTFIERFESYEYKESKQSHYDWYDLETNKLLNQAETELDYLNNIKLIKHD